MPCAGKIERRHAADPPSARCRRRGSQRILSSAPPAPKHQGHGRIVLGGELEAAGGGHAGAADLADDRTQAAVPQPLLHHRQRILVPAAFGVDNAVGRETGLRQSRSEQVAAAENPQHLAVLFKVRAAIPAANKVAAASSLRLELLPVSSWSAATAKPPPKP